MVRETVGRTETERVDTLPRLLSMCVCSSVGCRTYTLETPLGRRRKSSTVDGSKVCTPPMTPFTLQTKPDEIRESYDDFFLQESRALCLPELYRNNNPPGDRRTLTSVIRDSQYFLPAKGRILIPESRV